MSDELPEERSSRIAQLEARLSRRASVGVLPPVAALALALAGWVIWAQHEDVQYFFSTREPISLGVEGEYRFDRAVHNRYVQLHGAPALRAAYGVEDGRSFVIVGVQNTPLLIKRGLLPTEEWRPGTTPPPPDQRTFNVSGRLVSREAATRTDLPALRPGWNWQWSDGFLKHDTYGEQKPKWLLIEGARPGADLRAMSWFGVVLAFAGINLWLLVRGLGALLAARRAPR